MGCVTFQRGGTSEAGVVHDVRGPGHHRLKGHLLYFKLIDNENETDCCMFVVLEFDRSCYVIMSRDYA